MNRSLTLALVAGLFLSLAGCVSPDRERTRLEFERLREQTETPEEEKLLPDFGIDPWTEEALRLSPGSFDYSASA
jgi:hypothetical protein